MVFHAPLPLVAFSAYVTGLIFSHFVTLSGSDIFSRCFALLRFPSIIPVVQRCSSFSIFITWPKKVAWRFLFINGLVVSASRDTVSFDFFAVHQIRSILRRDRIKFFCCLQFLFVAVLFFACAILEASLMLLRPSPDRKEPKYLK